MVRIANISGFYGDRIDAARDQVSLGAVDFITGDYLAELTMLVLAKDRMKNPDGGYAKTFLLQLKDLLGAVVKGGVRVVVNAGGLNPEGLAKAIREAAAKAQVSVRVGVVTGDQLVERIADLKARGEALRNLDTGVPLSDHPGQVLTANAYLGSWGIVRALEEGAQIVITGRVTDAALTVGPAAFAHGWRHDDWDRLAGALAAGHVIECGAQATGGNYAFFDEVPSWDKPGFPIAEIEADGSSVITKHPGTGGLVSVGTVTAQLLYEIGGPAYLSPDVVARFDSLKLSDEGPDRVRISGVRGGPPPATLKAGFNLAAGWRNEVRVLLGGHNIPKKAAIFAEQFWAAQGGRERFAETRTDVIGGRSDAPATLEESLAVVQLSARDPDQQKLGRPFGAAAVSLALSSVPGITLAHLPGEPSLCGVFWPTLIDRDAVTVKVRVDDGEELVVAHPPRHGDVMIRAAVAPPGRAPTGVQRSVWLGDVAGARSGDKAGNANCGFWVKDPGLYAWLRDTVTADQIAKWLAPSGFVGKVEVHEFPNLLALNVVIIGLLDEGVASSLRIDAQGKCLGEFFRAQRVEIDAGWLG